MSHTENTNSPASNTLSAYFTPKTLTELGLDGTSLTVALRYQDTRLAKRGVAALMGKLPLMSDQPVAMDLDLGCVLLDKAHQVLDVIWYAKLRTADETIRHSGDALVGAQDFEDSLIHQEEIRLRPDELDPQVHHLAFVVSSYHNQPLSLATKGVVSFMDNERHIAHSVELASLPKTCQTLLTWVLSRQDQNWLLSAPLLAIDAASSADKRLDRLSQEIRQQLTTLDARW